MVWVLAFWLVVHFLRPEVSLLHGECESVGRCSFSLPLVNTSLAPDPFFASFFSFRFVWDTNLARHIKNCSLHFLV